MAIYLFVTSQDLHIYNHCFTLGTSFTSSLEAKSCGYQRKHNQRQNVDNTLPRFHTPYIVCDAKNCGQRNFIQWLLSAIAPRSFAKRNHTVANHYSPSYNTELWRSVKSYFEHNTYAHCGIT